MTASIQPALIRQNTVGRDHDCSYSYRWLQLLDCMLLDCVNRLQTQCPNIDYVNLHQGNEGQAAPISVMFCNMNMLQIVSGQQFSKASALSNVLSLVAAVAVLTGAMAQTVPSPEVSPVVESPAL